MPQTGTINGTPVPLRYDATERAKSVSWVLDPTHDFGSWIELPYLADVSIQVFGAAGATGFNSQTIDIVGSNEDPKPAEGAAGNEQVCEDHQGNALSFTASTAIKGLDAICRFIRPQARAGHVGAAGVTIVMLFHRPMRGA